MQIAKRNVQAEPGEIQIAMENIRMEKFAI